MPVPPVARAFCRRQCSRSPPSKTAGMAMLLIYLRLLERPGTGAPSPLGFIWVTPEIFIFPILVLAKISAVP
jgi:hypothetical protein